MLLSVNTETFIYIFWGVCLQSYLPFELSTFLFNAISVTQLVIVSVCLLCRMQSFSGACVSHSSRKHQGADASKC